VVELMVGIVVLSILLSLAVPSFQLWIQNTQVRTAAESVQSGLQMARAQAVARNANVEFTMGAGLSWSVNWINGGVKITVPNGAKAANEGAATISAAILPAGTTTITFNSLGGVNPANDPAGSSPGTPPLTSITLSSSTANSAPLRVTVGAGGNTRMCDPMLPPYSPTNPRGCQP
jgi:type IV fimbrial biogenesis protein FimT